MADALVGSGQYRVQRRIKPRPRIEPPAGTDLKLALFVDVETTGLDHQSDEIIELAVVPFLLSLTMPASIAASWKSSRRDSP